MRVQSFNLARKRDTLNDVTTRQPFANGPFAKMVAKIGYCYAVAKLGFDAFAVMQAGAARACERDHVMVAAVRAVHEGDIAFRRVGEAQAQHIAVKTDRAADVGGVQRKMRK